MGQSKLGEQRTAISNWLTLIGAMHWSHHFMCQDELSDCGFRDTYIHHKQQNYSLGKTPTSKTIPVTLCCEILRNPYFPTHLLLCSILHPPILPSALPPSYPPYHRYDHSTCTYYYSPSFPPSTGRCHTTVMSRLSLRSILQSYSSPSLMTLWWLRWGGREGERKLHVHVHVFEFSPFASSSLLIFPPPFFPL